MDTAAQVDALINEGINELKAGRKDTARNLLSQAVKTNPRNERAWLYLSATLPPAQAIESLQRVLAINPQNQQALRAIEALSNRATSVPGPGDDIPTHIPPAMRSTPNPIPATPTENVQYPPPSETNGYYGGTERSGQSYTTEAEQAYSPYAPQPGERAPLVSRYMSETAAPKSSDAEPIASNPFVPELYNEAKSNNRSNRVYEPVESADDLRSVLAEPYVAKANAERHSIFPFALIGLLLILLIGAGIAIYFLVFDTSGNIPQTAILPTAIANVPATVVVSTPTAVITAVPTATENLPTATAVAPLLPTSTPLPSVINLQVVQNQPAKLNGFNLTISGYDNHSSNFVEQGAGKPRTGTHYEGAVVILQNTYNKVLSISPKLFQAVDGRNNYASALDGGRLPALDVPRLQPGERRAAWLTFEVGDGTTLRAITFNPASEPDDKNTVLVNLVAPLFKGTVPVNPTLLASTPTMLPTETQSSTPEASPAPAVSTGVIGKVNSLNKINLSVISYNPAPNVRPFILPANYHYESVQIRVENLDTTKDISEYLKTFPFMLRDADGYVYTIGPLNADGTDHFDPAKFTAASNSKTPAVAKLTGNIYFLVRDVAKNQARTFIWYTGKEVQADRVEVSLK